VLRMMVARSSSQSVRSTGPFDSSSLAAESKMQ